VLVNNAGATWGAEFDEFPDSAWDKVLGLNVRAPFVLTRLARPLLEASTTPDDPARVINIGSIDGLLVPGFKNFSIRAKSPVGRVGRTEDVGAAAIYLAAPATTFMTGAVIPLDGGLSTTIGMGVEL
jgi:NAD(P)-dependent dehydrogenase (short-subunit alcohol dehydrogenase family)